MKRHNILSLALLIAALLQFCNAVKSQDSQAPTGQSLLSEDQLEGDIDAPDFPKGLEWLNTAQPISLESLQGKIVLLEFWTSCCINCIHVVSDLTRLGEKYAKEVVVIGVHSAKFANERDSETIRQAILRYGIHHPVVNDNQLQVWNNYGVNTWPTFVLINPNGRVIGVHCGEGVYELFDRVISQAVEYFDSEHRLSRSPMNFAGEASKKENSLLNFPCKIIATADGTRLFLSDSNHNRVLGIAANGEIEMVIGSGRRGNQDGTFETASFNQPQGIALDDTILYIADTENHTIRSANLKTKVITTVLGTGQQAREANAGGVGMSVALNSPWDLVVHNNKLYIAMAGAHQIWEADLKTLKAKPFAGTGREARIDGRLLQAFLAQPSGITTDGKRLYFVDSETSSVRAADIAKNGEVETIIEGNLTVYGDSDGDSTMARLQHPLGITYHDGLLYVADTYNHKIKVVDPSKKTAITLAGSGMRGDNGGVLAAAEFNEPSGLTFAGDSLFVADCNSHQIRVVNIMSRQVGSLDLSNLEVVAKQTMNTYTGSEIGLAPSKLKTGSGRISVALMLPEGYQLNEKAPFFVRFVSSDSQMVAFDAAPDQIQLNRATGEFEIPITGVAGSAVVTIETVVYLRKEGTRECLFDMIRARVPIMIDPAAAGMFGVGFRVTAMPRM